LQPASKTLGLHRVFIRGYGLRYVIASSTFKRIQVDARSCWLDTGEHHRDLALRTSGALDYDGWNDGRQVLSLGHDASLEQAGAQHSLSPVMPGRRSGDCVVCASRDQMRVNSRGIVGDSRGITGTTYQFAEFNASPATRMVFAAALASTACPIAFGCRAPPLCVQVSAGEPDDRGDARILRAMHRSRPAVRCALAPIAPRRLPGSAPGTMRPVKRPARPCRSPPG
jgi:hypothetical protein